MSTMSIALSGMMAASARLTASASNIANMRTDGPVPATAPSQPVSQAPGSVYQAVTAVTSAMAGGGVSVATVPVVPSYGLAYDPTSSFANTTGMVATPDVDPAREMVEQKLASFAYAANLKAFKAASDTQKALLDAMA